jgi:predicted nucleic acid-binding protein
MIFLDTNVAAGLFDPNGNKIPPYVSAVDKLLTDFDDKTVIAPTPVCLELAKYTREWYTFLNSKERPPCFRYWGYSITASIQDIAAKYLLQVSPKQNDPEVKQKVSVMDALIAAYCLEFNSSLITCNQQDFSVALFDVVGIQYAISSKRPERNILCLLKPNNSWKALLCEN